MGTSTTPHNQNKLLLRLATALGGDVLIPEALQGQERMSEDFSYTISAFSEQRHDIEPKELVGTPLTAMIVQEDGSERYINGYVNHVQGAGRSFEGQRSHYRITIGSWLWFLGQRHDSRIFQYMSVPDILEKVFAPLSGLGKAKFDLLGGHDTERFIVQYNETDLNFAYRLMRRNNIGFFITHDNGSHVVNLIDDGNKCPTQSPSELKLIAKTPDYDHLASWTSRQSFATGKVVRRAYDYRSPSAPVEAEGDASGTPVADLPRAMEMEDYRYTGRYGDMSAGETYVRRRVAEHTERQYVASGRGTYRELAVGHSFKVKSVPDGKLVEQGRAFVFSGVSINVNNGGGAPFEVSFEAIPAGQLVFPRGAQPRIPGMQTAVVTGPEEGNNKEVFTDHDKAKLGRVKVMFHWDRDGELKEENTCWLRVMQPFASSNFGAQMLPRVGDEVVVAFEDGDPDRPFVIGGLYHAERQPPFGAEPTKSGFRTRTFGGGASNYNELSFDDKKGSEQVYVQAEKDLKVNVKNDRNEQIGNNVATTVKNNGSADYGKELTVTAGNKLTLQVGGNSIVIDKSGITITGGAVTINGSPTSIN